jgi:hypothetical protein
MEEGVNLTVFVKGWAAIAEDHFTIDQSLSGELEDSVRAAKRTPPRPVKVGKHHVLKFGR